MSRGGISVVTFIKEEGEQEGDIEESHDHHEKEGRK